ncbi:MAG: GNAT family N-acetyltransferase [Deltaproteobacteria bacterium]|nr:MAG: GNAT family N-acetyltransferase [Deltaproteobacteria bacterium]
MAHASKHSLVDTLMQVADDLDGRGLVHRTVEDDALEDNRITIDGRAMVNFGSCSYLALERHPRLVAGSASALRRFGTQFSSSRAFLGLRMYEDLEAALERIFERPVVAAATTTLGHLAAMPVLVHDDDAVILDLQVHSSVQMAAQLLKARGVPLHIIRHNDMAQLERKVALLQGQHRRVWYMADGIYSMFGDFAPLPELVALLDRYKGLHLYIDDAHGMGWTGDRGCGYVRSQIPHHPKMVLAISLNKSFASAGGALVFPDREAADEVKSCGGTMIFSGPIQPPMLGAALASTELHLSGEITALQEELAGLIRHTNARIRELQLPQYCEAESPLFFIPLGLPRLVAKLANRVQRDGFYVNVATFPATPMRQGGLRFMINRALTREDIDRMLASVAWHYPRVLAEEGLTIADVARAFRLPSLPVPPLDTASTEGASTRGLSVERARTIAALDPALWDGLFSGAGNHTHAGLRLLEGVFADGAEPENRWDFHYRVVRDDAGRVVAATWYTVSLFKDDMLAPAAVSRRVERMREADPGFLVSRTVMLGSPISKGRLLHLDRSHPAWRQAVALLLSELQATQEAAGARQVMVRDFAYGDDPELRQLMLDLGYAEQRLPDVCLVEDLDWPDHDAWLERLGQKYRYNVRREILPFVDTFDLVTTSPESDAEIDACYALYCQVHARSYEMNVHRLPRAYFAALCRHSDYEVLRLYLRDDPRGADRQPVAVMFSFVEGGAYSALIVGLDDATLRTHNTYKQILYRTVHRARDLGCERLDLAYTAVLEKKKVGARPHPVAAYVQAQDHYNHAVLEAMGQQA